MDGGIYVAIMEENHGKKLKVYELERLKIQ